jgi:hypothetical protein
VKLGSLVTVLFLGQAASACPLCDTEAGGAVRSGIFDGNFASHLLGVLAPALALAGLAALLAFLPAQRPAEPASRSPHAPRN